MKYTSEYIEQVNKDKGFINSNVEKVLRLLDVLSFIFEKSSFQEKVVLKGGTAINLCYSNLKRLSVDIDLDYQWSLEKSETLKDKSSILEELDDYMFAQGYRISKRTRGSAILVSKTYNYINAFNNNDNIKIEINFIDRISLYPTAAIKVNQFEKSVILKVPSKEELYGMKICALIDRSKPRDLYDVFLLLKNTKTINQEKLRKSILFYLSLDGIYLINNYTFNKIKTIKPIDIKKELWPVLSKCETFNLEEAVDYVVHQLTLLLQLNDHEEQYLSDFGKGHFNPHLLFDPATAKRAEKHPMAKWKVINKKK